MVNGGKQGDVEGTRSKVETGGVREQRNTEGNPWENGEPQCGLAICVGTLNTGKCEVREHDRHSEWGGWSGGRDRLGVIPPERG